jgi:hypothetical protein
MYGVHLSICQCHISVPVIFTKEEVSEQQDTHDRKDMYPFIKR